MGSGLSISVFRSVGFSWLGVRGWVLVGSGFGGLGPGTSGLDAHGFAGVWGSGLEGPITTTTTATTTAGTATTAPATTAAATTTTTAASTVTSTTISASIAASRLMTASTTASTGDHYDYYDHGDYGKDYCCCCCCCCNINSASSLTSDVRASWLLACYWPCLCGFCALILLHSRNPVIQSSELPCLSRRSKTRKHLADTGRGFESDAGDEARACDLATLENGFRSFWLLR